VTSRFDAVFVDRDGTLNEKAPEGAYITSPTKLVLIDGVGSGISRLNEAGIPVYVVTNQRGVARSIMTEDDVVAVNEQLTILLKEFGAFVDGVYVCPHEIGVCECRKPMPGLLVRCAADHPPLRLSHSVMIGDTETDITAGNVVGTQTILVGIISTPTAADFRVSSFEAAVRIVLSEN